MLCPEAFYFSELVTWLCLTAGVLREQMECLVRRFYTGVYTHTHIHTDFYLCLFGSTITMKEDGDKAKVIYSKLLI